MLYCFSEVHLKDFTSLLLKESKSSQRGFVINRKDTFQQLIQTMQHLLRMILKKSSHLLRLQIYKAR